MLRKAIEQNWSKPVTVEQAGKTLRLAENARQQATQQEIDDARITERKRQRKRRKDAALVIFNGLSAEERSAIEQAAYKHLNSDFFRRQFRTDEQFCLQQCLDELCRREGTVPTSLSAAT